MSKNFIRQVNPYKKIEPLKFDLREYAQYAKEHNLNGLHMPEKIMKNFKL